MFITIRTTGFIYNYILHKHYSTLWYKASNHHLTPT